MGKFDDYECEGQMSIFDYMQQDEPGKTSLKRKNEYTSPYCTNCGAAVTGWKLIGQWPYQVMKLAEVCPGCNKPIEHPADLIERADYISNWCTDNKTPCKREKTWEKAIKHGVECPMTCCVRECNIPCVIRDESCTKRPKGMKSSSICVVICEHDRKYWCNRFGISAEEQRKAAPKAGWACKGCCYYCSAAPQHGGNCKWDCRVKRENYEQ